MRKIPSSFEILVGARGGLKEAIEYDGWKWLVGSFSKNTQYPVNLSDLVYFYPLVVKYLRKEIGDSDTIAVSLPAETWYEDNLTGKNLQNQISSSIRKEVGLNVVVLPQGIIALQEVFAKGYLKPEGNTLVIDGGFNTINIAIADKTGEILFTRTYYNEFGIRDLLENYFKPELKRKYPETTSNLQRLKEVFLKEKIDTGLQVIDITSEKNRSLQVFLKALFGRILKDIERAGQSFSQFVILGGISYYVPKIETNKPYFIPEKEGEFLTVKGMKRHTSLPSIDFGFGDIKFDGGKR